MDNLLKEIIQLEEDSDRLLIIYIKPRNKNKVIIYDTEYAAFDIIENKLFFDLLDYKSFGIELNDIKNINIQKCDDNLIIASVLLKNGNTIIIHFLF